MRSYRPEELFEGQGRLKPELAELAPKGGRRMGANPHANGGLLLRDLILPDFLFMVTLARSMPQLGMLAILVILSLQMLSGGFTPRESMPVLVQNLMLAAPTTHFVAAGQAILFRGAGIDVVWPQFLALIVIGSVFFTIALSRFRKTISRMT
jgi:hypothetical protein